MITQLSAYRNVSNSEEQHDLMMHYDTRRWQLGSYVTLAGGGRMHGTGNRSFCGQTILTHWQRQDLLPQIF